MDSIAVFHRGTSGGLWYNVKQGGTWVGDVQVPGVEISADPSAICLKSNVMVFHQGASNNNLLYNASIVNLPLVIKSWGDTIVNDTKLSDKPSALISETDSLIHVYHQGSNNNNELWEKIGDGVTWAADSRVSAARLMAFGPSAVEYQGKIYVFYQGWRPARLDQQAGGDNSLWYNIYHPDLKTWDAAKQVASTGVSSSPCAVVFNNKIFVIHQGSDNNGALWYNSFDGTNWAGDQRAVAADGSNIGMSDSPSAIVRSDGTLAVFHQGYDDDQALWETSYDGGKTWAADARVANTSLTFGPSAVLWPYE